MEVKLKNIRDILVIHAWEEYKNTITMNDLAVIFKIDLSSIYRILKENYEA